MKDAAMWKTILILARHTFIRLLWLLLPLGIFAFLVRAIPLSPLQALCGLIPVIIFEIWLVVKYLLPGMSDLVTKTLYASNITTDEEVLVDAARRMLGAGDAGGRPGAFGTQSQGESRNGASLADGIRSAE